MVNDKKPAPPPGLGTRGRRYWRETTAEYELSPSELVILAEACRTLDNLDALDVAIRDAGAVVEGSAGQPVINGALTEARGQRLALHRLVAALALPDADAEPVPTARTLRAQNAARSRWRGHEKRGA